MTQASRNMPDPVMDHTFMKRALVLAANGRLTTAPNPVVGCVIVDRHGAIIAEGWHARAGGPHAEISALEQCGWEARGATCYVTLEPCVHQGKTGPCVQPLIQSGIARVVVAMVDPNPRVAGAGIRCLQEAGMVVEVGLCESEAVALNPGFVSRMERGIPWIRSKIAISLDGRTALHNGVSQWITNEAARLDVQRWRAQSDALLTTAATVIADNPQMTVRIPVQSDKNIKRIVLDSKGVTSPKALFFSFPGAVLCTIGSGRLGGAQRKVLASLDALGVEIWKLPADPEGHVDLQSLFQKLGALEINEVLFEVGPRLNGFLLRQGWVDEWIVYQAAKILGPNGRPMFAVEDPSDMADTEKLFELQCIELKLMEGFSRMRLRPQKRFAARVAQQTNRKGSISCSRVL
jgi:diaminohydroxyphosphoribosylaminopyrimidine deaminase/5-amino-6-(5-phosphoribosylamino)uracil reductase